MSALLLLLALGAQRPITVGDTVWAAVTVAVPSRMIVRPQAWDLGDAGQVLGPPEVIVTGDSATVRYPVALWYPGRHSLRIPGPIVVSPEGQSDTLPARAVAVEVTSVLPRDTSRLALEPEPAATPLAQTSPSLLPLAVLGALAGAVYGLALLAARAARRRRQRALPPPARIPVDFEATLRRWAELGELRAAVDGWAHVIAAEAHEAGRAPDPRVAAWLEAAERAGFRSDRDSAELERLLATLPAGGRR